MVSGRNDGYPGPPIDMARMPQPPAGPGSGSEVWPPAPYPPLQRVAEAILLWAGDKLYDQAQFADAGLVVARLGPRVSPNLVSAQQLAASPWAVEVAALRWAAQMLRDDHQDDAARLVDSWAAGFAALP